MWLDISEVSLEQLLGPSYREFFHYIDIFTTTVIALTRITFCILVGENRALRFHDKGTGVIFRRNKFDVFFLTCFFCFDSCTNFWIKFRYADIALEHLVLHGPGWGIFEGAILHDESAHSIIIILCPQYPLVHITP